MSEKADEVAGRTEQMGTELYMTNPEFHARVEMAVDLTRWTLRQVQHEMSASEEAIATQAAIFGLLSSKVDTSTFSPELQMKVMANMFRMNVQYDEMMERVNSGEVEMKFETD